MKDPISITRIQQLHPAVRDTFMQFITECEETQGITLRIMLPVYRTIAEQNALYAQGRTAPGAIVTNAPGGTSFHNFGLAADLCAVNENGEMNWNYDNATLAPIAKKYNLEWGGDWVHIKDRPHFEARMGFTENCSDALELVQAGQVDENGYVLIPGAA